MQALEQLQLVEQLCECGHIQELAQIFSARLSKAFGLGNVFVFHYIAEHHTISPIGTSSPELIGELRSISINEIDNPLVYALINNQKCFVENISTLLDIGSGFEALKELMSNNDALYIVPLKTTQGKQRTYALMMCHGQISNVNEVREDVSWSILITIFSRLLATLFELEKHDTSEPIEQIYSPSHVETKRKAFSAQFIASEYIGQSENAQAIRSAILTMAPTSVSILLTGETGVGKDYIASLIHKVSDRSNGKFIAVNCAAIPSGLIESELFGNVKGAFTGAFNRNGLVAKAHKGTLFLDEIGDMPLDMQAALLRLLNEKTYRPVGSSEEKKSDFRLICATNKNLHELILKGVFREDLYYRICQDMIEIMPLRERITDISDLCSFLIAQFYLRFNKRISGIEANALNRLKQHSFPGNLRELKNYIYAACEYTKSNLRISSDIIEKLIQKATFQAQQSEPQLDLHSIYPLEQCHATNNIIETLAEIEKQIIASRLQLFYGSRAKAAQSLGIPLRTLARRCQQWEID